MIALLACRMSIASLTLLFGLGTATTLDTHGVGPDIFSIMSFFSSFLILSSTKLLILKGICRNGCATGGIASSICRLS